MPSALWRGCIPIAVGNVFTEKVVTTKLLDQVLPRVVVQRDAK